jgi:hypothetical protein
MFLLGMDIINPRQQGMVIIMCPLLSIVAITIPATLASPSTLTRQLGTNTIAHPNLPLIIKTIVMKMTKTSPQMCSMLITMSFIRYRIMSPTAVTTNLFTMKKIRTRFDHQSVLRESTTSEIFCVEGGRS